MKIRVDFVTNSSSSSFIAWGFSKGLFEDNISDELRLSYFENIKKDYLKRSQKDNNEYCKNKYDELSKIIERDDIIKWVEENVDVENLLDYTLFELGGQEKDWVGIPLDSLMRNVSGLKLSDIEMFVKQEAKEKLGINIENVDYIEECWYDG